MIMKTTFQKYAAYKDSGVEWLGEIPEHWETMRLRNIFDFCKGLTITKENLEKEGIPVVNYGEIHSKYGFILDPTIHRLKCVSDTYLKDNQKSLLEKGDFIFADTSEDLEGSGNFTHLVADIQTFAGYHTIIGKPKRTLNSKYVAYVLDSFSFRNQVRTRMNGVKVFSITQSILKELTCWFPSPEEQTAIAHFLDDKTAKIDRAIAQKEKMIALLKERKQIIIQNLVTGKKVWNPGQNAWTEPAEVKDSGVEWIGEIPEGWEVCSVKHVLEIPITDGPHETPLLLENGIPFISAESIKYGRIDFEKKRGFISESEHNRFCKKYKPKRGDIYMVKSGATTGNIGIVDVDFEFSIWSPLAVFRPKTEIIRTMFLYYFLDSYSFKKGVELKWSFGTQQNIGMGVLSNLPIATPPIQEQTAIIAHIEAQSAKIDKAIALQEQQIEKLKELKATLIDGAVTGKIRVPSVQEKK